jgi:predicted helicase
MGKQAISQENARRINQQNDRKISVIIGNPPYNANQMNENENNKNRLYDRIDRRIKETYIAASTAQKTKLYDMYARFLRWATDRIPENGIVAFVSNNSFINSTTFDGFRKMVVKEFNEIWIVDMKGNARTSGERRRQEKGNVFEDKIRVGVAVYFLVRNKEEEKCKIFYTAVDDYLNTQEKQNYLAYNTLKSLPFQRIRPDKNGNWIHLADDNDWENLLSLCSKDAKYGRGNETIFELFSLGVVTNRDEWVYDFSKENLKKKVQFFIDFYNQERKRLFGEANLENVANLIDYSIKWTRDVKKDLLKNIEYELDSSHLIQVLYRPFVKKYLFFSRDLNEMQYKLPAIFGKVGELSNSAISLRNQTSSKDFFLLTTSKIPDLHFTGDSNCLPLYRYENGERKENISDWALELFGTRYEGQGTRKKNTSLAPHPSSCISKQDIFHYVYAVLHNPAYRQKYEQNLKRDFPRIPLYEDFWAWASWGKELMELHLNYENVDPFPLIREDKALKVSLGDLKPKLKVDKELGIISLDEQTDLAAIPSEAWEYKLGNRSALEWILDQYKESKPSDPTILEKFNIYRFADYKGELIDLLKRVCRVSVETMRIMKEMEIFSASAEK